MATVTIALPTGEKVELELEPKTFSKGTQGFYYRGRIDLGKANYHCQIIISK